MFFSVTDGFMSCLIALDSESIDIPPYRGKSCITSTTMGNAKYSITLKHLYDYHIHSQKTLQITRTAPLVLLALSKSTVCCK